MKWLPLFIAWIMEVATATSFLFMPKQALIPTYLLFHGAICLYSVHCLKTVLPLAHQSHSLSKKLFFLVNHFFLPIIGMTCTVLLIIPALFNAQSKKQKLFFTIPSMLLSSKEITQLQERIKLQPSTLKHLIDKTENISQKLSAITALHYLSTPEVTHLLKNTLSDENDDIRLTTYGILEQKEYQLMLSINKTEKELHSINTISKKNTKNNQPLSIYIYQKLAYLNWQLIHQQLLQGKNTIQDVENKILNYTSIALDDSQNNIDMHILRGKVHLHRNALTLAQASFHAALKAGAQPVLILPSLLEIAFTQRNFSEFNQLMNSLSPTAWNSIRLSHVQKQWHSNYQHIAFYEEKKCY